MHLGWHIIPFPDKGLNHGAGPVPEPGVKLIEPRGASICNHGLHYSPTVSNAHSYESMYVGSMLCLVAASDPDPSNVHGDKECSPDRTILARLILDADDKAYLDSIQSDVDKNKTDCLRNSNDYGWACNCSERTKQIRDELDSYFLARMGIDHEDFDLSDIVSADCPIQICNSVTIY